MKLKTALYLFLVAALVLSIIILFGSVKNTYNSQSYEDTQNNDILVHPEKYPYHDTPEEKVELKGTDAVLDDSDSWTEFLPGLNLHSAFADETKKSSETLIRIIAIGTKLYLYKHKIQCVFENNGTQWKDALVDYSIIRHWSLRSFMFVCITRSKTIPLKISLESEDTGNKSQFLNIHYQDRSFHKHEITICVLPSENYNNIELLAEFLSYYDAVGVSMFNFYDCNMTDNMHSFINMVSRSGINITIIPWTISNATRLSKQRILEITSIQHCILRNRGKTKYVLPLNIDEFLVPRQHFSLTELINELRSVSKLKIGSYIFRQSQFCSKSTNFKKQTDDKLVSSRDIFREEKIWPSKKQSRYIAEPDTVIEGGLHNVRKHKQDWKSANVPWQLALIHHYTVCLNKKENLKLIEDRTAESFKYEILLSKPMAAFREFKSTITANKSNKKN